MSCPATSAGGERFPGPTPVGHLRHLPGLLGLGGPYRTLLDLHRRHGPVCAVGFGRHRYTLLFGTEANRLVLADPPARPRFLSGEVLGLLVPVVGARAMVVSDGEEHRRRRALVQPAFTHRRVRAHLPLMLEEIHRVLARWRPGQRVDAFTELRGCIRRIAVRALFGPRLQAHTESIGRDLETALRYVNRSPFLRCDRDLPGSAFHRAMAARRRVDDRVRAEIAHRRSAPGDEEDVLDALLSSATPAGDRLTDGEVRDQVISLIASGYDSSSAAAGWAVHVLVNRPDLWERLADEVTAVAAGRPLTASHLDAMPYLDWTISELLRLFTPGVLTGRTAREEITFVGHRIPAGTRLLHSAYVTHRLPRVWDEPLEFRPDRWNPARAGHRPPHPYAYIPFGGGYRRCVGAAFAELELRALVAELVRCTELAPVRRTVRPTGVATMWPHGGVPVTVRAVRPPHPARGTSRAS
ncbi:cytochrome P450 [Streptomyces zingiberis]|uniref:Cytochrome P450 n=1 Tax=Streptomyces zingiberis TaxID=2053010 RepID=A0ABX1BVY6_9ACTN|nr:cytochrome P450 [Streptomyces zingiberis]NJQ00423.1 cytochrome P450 [Streptomyces zingiberis]